MVKLKTHLMAASAAALAFTATPSSAATIVLNDVGGVTGSPAEMGFQIAAWFWGQQLTDNVTINLDVAFNQLDPNVLGGTRSTRVDINVSDVYNALAADSTSALDASAVSNLETLNGGAVTVISNGDADLVNGTGVDATTRVIDNDGSANNSILWANSANLKALGFDPGAGPDGSVEFNSDFTWDYDPTDGVDAGTYDFIGVAIHEIGHALGFVSGVDIYDLYGCDAGPLCEDGKDFDFDSFGLNSVADLFRYSDDGELNWAAGGDDTYFSIDGGASELFGNSAMSTGSFNGDGWQASHFKANGTCEDFIGILNPYLCSGTLAEVSITDLAYFDAMGWDANVDVLGNPDWKMDTADIFVAYNNQQQPVPEPATWLQMLLGFLALGGALRFRRKPALVKA